MVTIGLCPCRKRKGWLRGKLFEIDPHKHCSHCGGGSCTICNFVGNFLTECWWKGEVHWLVHLMTMISWFPRAKETILVVSKYLGFHVADKSANGQESSLLHCTPALHTTSTAIGEQGSWDVLSFFQDSILLFVLNFAVID